MTEINIQSNKIVSRAELYLPSGVSGADRVLDPNLVFNQADGAYVVDADGHRYIDYHCAFGSIILGHCHAEVNQQIRDVISSVDLVSVGTNELEVDLAKKITEHLPSAEKVLFCNSGSEATYAAIRLARAVTKRKKILKFQGCYHGWHDAVLMNVLTSQEKLGQKDPESAGMTPEVVADTFVLPFNNIVEVTRLITECGDQIAAVILEPIPHNIGCILPEQQFLQCLRELTYQYGIVLIFDEVISGFRHGLGGYQKIAGVIPDLTTLGKAIANGYPLAALCGRSELMDHLGKDGDVMFSGTFNAHPVGIAAGLATIRVLERPDSYNHLFGLGQRMRQGLTEIIDRRGVQAMVAGFGSIFVIYFMSPPVKDYADLFRNNAIKFMSYRRQMIQRGIYELPRYLKRNHISIAHTITDIDNSLDAADAILKLMN